MPPTTSAAATTVGLEQLLLDPVMDEEPDHRGRQEGDQQVQQKPAARRIGPGGEHGVCASRAR